MHCRQGADKRQRAVYYSGFITHHFEDKFDEFEFEKIVLYFVDSFSIHIDATLKSM